jgi:hypothetical protein
MGSVYTTICHQGELDTIKMMKQILGLGRTGEVNLC